MITWSIVNAVCGAVDGAIIAYELRLYGKYLTLLERWGKATIGAALILTIAPILANGGAPYLSRAGQPFNLWPSFMLRFGIGLLFVGRIIRHRRHERANAAQMKIAREHFASKRKVPVLPQNGSAPPDC